MIKIFAQNGTIMRLKKINKRELATIGIWLFLVSSSSIFTWNAAAAASDGNEGKMKNKISVKETRFHLMPDDTIRHLVTHPAFKGFGPHLLPRDNAKKNYNLKLSNIGSLLPYHSHVDADVVVSAINHMIDRADDGDTLFYDFYTEQQKQEDPAKSSAGLFFFRGQPGAPFAVICPGGGFTYVGSLHEGFPLAMVLSQKGYNAFVLRYRTGGGLRAAEDLAAAISYIFKNADRLEVGVGDYSLWGGSAGARMVGNIALHGTVGYGGDEIPDPSIVVIAYTGHAIFSKDFPPTFIMVSEDDGIVHVPTVDRRVKNLKNAGVDVAYHKFKNAGHGFGLGVGTDAEGWINAAIRFWENHSWFASAPPANHFPTGY